MTDEDDEALKELVPVPFTATAKKRDDEDPRPFTLDAMKGEDVVVRANGFTYTGRLVGADEGELYLRTEMRWVVLPLSSIASVRLVDKKPAPLGLPDALDAAIAIAPAPPAPPSHARLDDGDDDNVRSLDDE